MKILHLQTELNLACGITRTISQIIKNSSPKFEYHLVALGGDGLSRFEKFNFEPILLNLDRRSLLDTFKISLFLFRYCKKHSIQMIHSHHRYFDTITWFIKIFIKVKTITSVQSKVYGKKLISYKSNRLIACGENIKDHLMKEFGINKNKIVVVHNSVDPQEIIIPKQTFQLRNDFGLKNDVKIIGFAGRLSFEEKGIDILLKAFRTATQNRDDLHLLLIGNGSDKNDIETFIKKENISATLIQAQANIYDYMNIIEVLVLPSRVDPFPLIMLEAGYMKKPFIGSNVDGIAEFIENEKDGLLFKSENVEDLTNCILRIINDSELAETLAENLYKKVIDNFLTSNIVAKYEYEYKKLLNPNVI